MYIGFEDYEFWYDPPDNRTLVDSFLQYSEAFPGGVHGHFQLSVVRVRLSDDA